MKKLKNLLLCISISLSLLGYPATTVHAFSDAQTKTNSSSLSPQITGPQKADGMWSVDFHKQIAQYQDRSLIASSPNGDILLITEDNVLHCLDFGGNIR